MTDDVSARDAALAKSKAAGQIPTDLPWFVRLYLWGWRVGYHLGAGRRLLLVVGVVGAVVLWWRLS